MRANRFGCAVLAFACLTFAADAGAIPVWNTDDTRPIWVTIYDNTGKIQTTSCVEPRQRKFVQTRGWIRVRAEVTVNAGCQHPVVCDTTISTGNDKVWVDLKTLGNRCWWDQYDDTKGVPPSRSYPFPPYTFPAVDPRKQAREYGEVLTTGQTLQSGGTLRSHGNRSSVRYTAYVAQQGDGNLCVYMGTPQTRVRASWCSDSAVGGGPFYTAMQADGNLCIYRTRGGGATWCNSKVAPGGQFFLSVSDGGNLCVYAGTPSAVRAVVWCSNTMAYDK